MNGDDNGNGHWPRDPIGRLMDSTPLEARAQRLLTHRSGPEEPILGLIEREMEFLLEQLDDLRTLHTDLDRDLLRSEARARTDILRLRAPQYKQRDDHESHRLALKRRGEELARERRSISLELHNRRRALLDRLGALVERHSLVGGAVGDGDGADAIG